MQIVKTIDEVRKIVKAWKKEGLTVGLVPTMGYLHEGHKSLIERAVKENDRVVVSDFVNPTQFGPNEDFESYPRDINADAKLCESAGASIIFNPEADEMYDNALTFVDMNKITKVLCGKTRPIHFSGVCTVVSKLFNIVQPDRAYFGQKDAQQLCVIKKMVKDLNVDIEIVGCPIIRENDGLAKSSRNKYLNADERKASLCLSRSLEIGKKKIADVLRGAAVGKRFYAARRNVSAFGSRHITADKVSVAVVGIDGIGEIAVVFGRADGRLFCGRRVGKRIGVAGDVRSAVKTVVFQFGDAFCGIVVKMGFAEIEHSSSVDYIDLVKSAVKTACHLIKAYSSVFGKNYFGKYLT